MKDNASYYTKPKIAIMIKTFSIMSQTYVSNVNNHILTMEHSEIFEICHRGKKEYSAY